MSALIHDPSCPSNHFTTFSHPYPDLFPSPSSCFPPYPLLQHPIGSSPCPPRSVWARNKVILFIAPLWVVTPSLSSLPAWAKHIPFLSTSCSFYSLPPFTGLCMQTLFHLASSLPCALSPLAISPGLSTVP